MTEDLGKASEKPKARSKKQPSQGSVAAGAAAVGAAAGLAGSELIPQGGSEGTVSADPADFDSASHPTAGAAGVSNTGSGFAPTGGETSADRSPPNSPAARPAEGSPGAPADGSTEPVSQSQAFYSAQDAMGDAADAGGDFAGRLGADIEHGIREVIENPGGALEDAYWTARDAAWEIDPRRHIEGAIEGMDEGAIPDAAGDTLRAAGDAAQYVGRTGADVVGKAQDTAEHAIGQVEDAADDVGDAFSDAADAAGDAAEDAGEAIGDAAEDAGEAIGDAAEDTEEAFEDAGEALNPFD